MANGKNVYNTLCAALDERNWKYEKHEEDLVVRFGVNGEDIPVGFAINVNDERDLIICFSRLPFSFPEDKRIDGCVAVSSVNYTMVSGSFDYDISDGSVTFRLINSYKGCTVDQELFTFIVDLTCTMVDKYNDKFFMLSKGMISIEDFLKSKAE